MLTISKQFGSLVTIFEECVDLAKLTNHTIKFEFNGCWFVVHKHCLGSEKVYNTILENVQNGFKGVTYL